MFKNYLLTAVRNLWRNKLFALINVLGLSIGISAAMVIYLIVHYEFSFEQFQPDKDRIYRIVTDVNNAGNLINNSGVPYPVADAARHEVPGIEECAALRMTWPNVTIPTTGATRPTIFKNHQDVTFTDDHYFSLFPDYRWLAGSPITALTNPFSTVLTASRAKLYFPGLTAEQVIGKHIVYDDTIPTTVTGVITDLEAATSLHFKEFISFATIPGSGLKKNMGATDWNGVTTSSQCFIKIMPGARPADIEAGIAGLRKKKAKPEPGTTLDHHLQPLTDIHFDSRYDALGQPHGSKPTLYGLTLVAVFLLLLACINFINLTTAQAAQRAKEIGIRKTLGSSAKQLITQFLGETLLLTAISLLLSLALTPWLLRIFSGFIPKDLPFNPLQQPGVLAFLLALLLTVTLLAGFYPALVLSRYKPVLVLKNQAFANSATTRSAWLRKTLTVFQFTIAQFFIMATLIVVGQIHYSISTDLGFKKEAIVTVGTPWLWGGKDHRRFALLDKVRALPGIEQACIGSFAPSDGGSMSQNTTYRDGKNEVPLNLQIKFADSNYVKLYHLNMLAGRAPATSDTMREFVINETCRHLLGFPSPADAIGKYLGDYPKLPIVGVMADFHHSSLRDPIQPLALSSARNFEFNLLIALRPNGLILPEAPTTWAATLAQVGRIHKEFFPEMDYSYEFFDESIAKFYTAEQNIARLLQWATGLTIFISCLGLAGLVIFTTNSRKKEIGIRKVLGASVTAIATLLSKDFVKLLVFAFIIATPIAWWALNKWLNNFAYRAPVSWWIFPLAGLGMITIALLTMSVRTIRSAKANPVTALHTD